MKAPQTENGFAMIANQILDEIGRAKLSGPELKVINFVFRKTYGFHRPFALFSKSEGARKTRLDRGQFRRVLNGLIKRNILYMEGDKVGYQKRSWLWDCDTQGTSYPGNDIPTPLGMTCPPDWEGDTHPPGYDSPIVHLKKEEKETRKKEEKENSCSIPRPSAENSPPPSHCFPEDGKTFSGSQENYQGVRLESGSGEGEKVKGGKGNPETDAGSASIEKQKPVRKKKTVDSFESKYSSCFEEFWEWYPKIRPGSKSKAYEKWKSYGLDENEVNRKTIMDHMAWSRANDPKWGDTYQVMPTVYLNGKRWEAKPVIGVIEVLPPARVIKSFKEQELERTRANNAAVFKRFLGGIKK